MKHIYKILLILILIITIAIYFYMNRYETHIADTPDTIFRAWIINKWSGEVLVCCMKGGWVNLGRPYMPRLEDILEELPDMIEPTPTN